METILVMRPHDEETYTAPTAFRLKDLPEDVRKLIYAQSNLLAIPHDNSLPNLLVALSPKKKLFAEALEIYKRTNYRVTKENIHIFKGMRMKELLRFQHLKVVCNEFNGPGHDETLHFRAHKILLHNNLESLTYVVHDNVELWPIAIDYIDYLVGASRTGIQKVTIKIPHKLNSQHRLGYVRRKLWKLKVVGKLDESYNREKTGYQIWTWEKPDGSCFKWLTMAECDEEMEKGKEREKLEKALILYEGPRKWVWVNGSVGVSD